MPLKMTIIVFLVDTSASMNQRAYSGCRTTLLDVAKTTVETFVKVRQKSMESRFDRYMLLTFEEPPANIKAGWKENLQTFMTELKNLQATGLTTLGAALRHTFDVLNLNRMQTGIDMYGQGRCPYFLEPSIILLVTDGGQFCSNNGIQDELTLPMNSPIPGSELTKEPFRWDQRLFALVLRIPGTPVPDRDSGLVPNDVARIDDMCEVTGGRSYCITSHRMLNQCIDSLVQKVQSGVVISFEKVGPDPTPITEDDVTIKEKENECMIVDESLPSLPNGNHVPTVPAQPAPLGTSWHTCRKLIYVVRSAQKGFAVGHWPIPEAFWPTANAMALPARNAHPSVKFSCENQEPMAIENLPFDKYELEPSPLTQYILSRKQPTVCWQVFVANSGLVPNSGSSDLGCPFGYLKASTSLTSVNLFVMPYNYPVLLPLLEDLFKVHKMKPSPDWKTQFSLYLRSMPSYYVGPLRRALVRMGANSISQSYLPESIDNGLSYTVVTYIKKLKNQARQEYDRLCSEVASRKTNTVEGIRVLPRSPLKREIISNPLLQDKFYHLRDQLNEFGGFVVCIRERETISRSYRNPFNIPRQNLLDQLQRMRANFLQPSIAQTRLQDEDYLHSMPVGQMGNYQEYLKRAPTLLREIESTPMRQHMFGNPFKIDKRMMVDEADVDLVGGAASQSRSSKRAAEILLSPQRPTKRKPGPLPHDIAIRRSPSPAPVASDLPSPIPSQTPPSAWVYNSNSVKSSTVQVDEVIQHDSLLPVPSVSVVAPSLPEICSMELNRSPSPPPLMFPPVFTPDPPSTNHVENVNNHVTSDISLSDSFNMLYAEESKEENKACDVTVIPDVLSHNRGLRTQAFKEVRRPGKNYDGLLLVLEKLRGSPEVRASVVKEVYLESLRFKRKAMAEVVQRHLQKVLLPT